MNNEEMLKLLDFARERKQQAKEDINKKKIIILNREQLNTNSPAIARINIIFPETLDPIVSHEVESIATHCRERKNISAEPYFKKLSHRHYIIEINGGSVMMYSWLEYFINTFKVRYSTRYNIIVTGHWDKFGN